MQQITLYLSSVRRIIRRLGVKGSDTPMSGGYEPLTQRRLLFFQPAKLYILNIHPIEGVPNCCDSQ